MEMALGSPGHICENRRMEPDILQQLLDQFVETRRHFDVATESFRADQRLLAEGIAAVDEKLSRQIRELRSEVKEGFDEMRSMIRFSYADLDRRMRELEESVSELRTRVLKLEAA
jgi:hypothetical protein